MTSMTTKEGIKYKSIYNEKDNDNIENLAATATA